MILDRRIHKAKLGCYDELVALGRAECDTWGVPYRIYAPLVGPRSIVVFESQFEDLAKWEEFWTIWWAKPEKLAWVAKFNALRENESSMELCDVL
jgi:hypothetical protein